MSWTEFAEAFAEAFADPKLPKIPGAIAVECAKEYAHLGYGTFGENLVYGLKQSGLQVWSPEVGQYSSPDNYPKEYKTVVWASVPGHAAITGKMREQHMVLFSMWETDYLPPTFSSNLHEANFDLVLVPNDHNVELFSQYHPNVLKVPLGYNSAIWKYHKRPEEIKEFRFLFCGAGASEKARKGSDIAIEAFKRAFPYWRNMDPQPKLIVKCLKMSPLEEEFMEVHTGRWSVTELRDLYYGCHAMILPSRGEGWGYHPQQAVATGIPAIVSDIPGHAEYTWLPGFTTIPTNKSKAPRFLQGEAGEWWEPNLDFTIDAMRHLYDHYPDYLSEAVQGAEVMPKLYSHYQMAQATIKAVGRENLTLGDQGEHMEFIEREYLTVTNRALGRGECNIGGVDYIFRPGDEYWVTANVREVLLQAGYLANSEETVSRI